MPTTYDSQNSYAKFQSECTCGAETQNDCSCGCGTTDDCGCCPVGTVAVYNEDGSHKGCLSPNDAEIFEAGTHVPTTGFVKVIDTNGKYYGDLPPAQAIDMLNYIDNAVVSGSASDTYNVVNPEVGASGWYELTYPTVDGITSTINLLLDRSGVDESITISIQNQSTPNAFAFDPSGTVTVMAATNSDKDVKFTWTGLAAGVHTFVLRFASTNVVKEVPIRLTLT